MLELKHITYTVSTPEGEQSILNDISIDIPITEPGSFHPGFQRFFILRYCR